MTHEGLAVIPLDEQQRLRRWRGVATLAAQPYRLRPALVGAIISRETRCHNVIGDGGHGYGLMQVDDSVSRKTGRVRDQDAYAWCQQWLAQGVATGEFWEGFPIYTGNEECGVYRGAVILHQKLIAVARLIPPDRILLTNSDDSSAFYERAAVAAYNCGADLVRDAVVAGEHVDHFTTGGDYSSDVLRRAAALESLWAS